MAETADTPSREHSPFRRALVDGAIYGYPLVMVLAIWEAVTDLGLVRPLFLPSVTTVVQQFWPLLVDHQIVEPLAVSLFRAFGGLVLAVVAGTAIGLAMARLKTVRWGLDPLVSLAFPSPKIAFVPIFILWFGIDHLSKILLVAFTCVFPMIVATYHGASSVSRIVLWSAQAMGTPERKIMTRIMLPASMPHIVNGLRITVPVALISAFTAEMVAGGGGIGAAMMYAQRFFQTPTVFVYIILMLLTGLVLDRGMTALRRRLLRWESDD
jgi:ABC-type nitrate/sulfonate/bicarbonate transport system permease component